jgi:cytochrome c553
MPRPARVRNGKRSAAGLALAASLLAPPPSPAAAPADRAAENRFEKKIRPLFIHRCHKCHGAAKAKGGLRLDSAAGLARGGQSGPVVVRGKPEESLLLKAVRRTGELKMPPEGKLSVQQIADLAAWVKAGTAWPGEAAAAPPSAHFTAEQKAFWAFQPVRPPRLPAVRNKEWPRSPVDHFILARLEAQGLKPAPPANRRTLLRRVTFDLTGLPPTPEEIDSFLGDKRPDAHERLVDRLLASPHHGERWGRHWLDVVRYAETTANDANAVMRYAWRYRDYVVDAFNADMPYHQFIVEQLAGDLLPAKSDQRAHARRVIATGFLMVGPKALAETDKEQTALDIADEQIDVTGRTFLGLTLACARCHDHKFDPIPTADYYALAGIFRGTQMFLDLNRNASMWQEYALPVKPGEKPIVVMAPKDGKAVNLRVHVRGNRFQLGPFVPRRFPRILADEKAPPLTTPQSGRLELARWVATRDNPLTARVMVNRLWQHHFGTGLVATSDNFGFRGDRPSHPELLDWLGDRFVRGGWSVKALHRRLVLSSTYRMACVPNAHAARIDAGNRLLWRMPRRRLEAEAIRDAMLAVSGRLDQRLGGAEASEYLWGKAETIGAKIRPNRLQADDSYYTTATRRSLYLPVVRNMLPDVLALFDAADPNGVTAARNETTVPSQTMFLLNSPLVRDQAMHLARLLAVDATKGDADRVRLAYLRAVGRPPTAEEVVEARDFLKGYVAEARRLGRPEHEARAAAWRSFCQMLLCSNEFLYVD